MLLSNACSTGENPQGSLQDRHADVDSEVTTELVNMELGSDIVLENRLAFDPETNQLTQFETDIDKNHYTFILTGEISGSAKALTSVKEHQWELITDAIDPTTASKVNIVNPSSLQTEVIVNTDIADSTLKFRLVTIYEDRRTDNSDPVEVRLKNGWRIYITQYGADQPSAANGSSWENAINGSEHLQNVIDAADSVVQNDPDIALVEIWVAAGVYKPLWQWGNENEDNAARKKSFRLHNNVALVGGFNGTEKAIHERVTSDDDEKIYQYETIFSG
ncbi:MAG: hypothetical protein ACN4E2_05955, partial [Nitrospinota bacterium]